MSTREGDSLRHGLPILGEALLTRAGPRGRQESVAALHHKGKGTPEAKTFRGRTNQAVRAGSAWRGTTTVAAARAVCAVNSGSALRVALLSGGGASTAPP